MLIVFYCELFFISPLVLSAIEKYRRKSIKIIDTLIILIRGVAFTGALPLTNFEEIRSIVGLQDLSTEVTSTLHKTKPSRSFRIYS